ncbi:MAG: zinc ribbon domain-containing protein [Desulfovibrio sp.]|nr:zinc ribbon domain-containing protein [Desulfovibrio sp.]
MPIYEYGCRACGHEFEELVFSDTNPLCPSCGSQDVQKLMSQCCHTGGDHGDYEGAASAHTSSCGCAGCAGGHCASCGH